MPPSAKRSAKPDEVQTSVGGCEDVGEKPRKDKIQEVNCRMQVRVCTNINQ